MPGRHDNNCYWTTTVRDVVPGSVRCEDYIRNPAYGLGIWVEPSCYTTPADWARLRAYGFSHVIAYPDQLNALYEGGWHPENILLSMQDLAYYASRNDGAGYNAVLDNIIAAILNAGVRFPGERFYGLGLNEVYQGGMPGILDRIIRSIRDTLPVYDDRLFMSVGYEFGETADANVNIIVERYSSDGPQFWEDAYRDVVRHNIDSLYHPESSRMVQMGFWISGDRVPGFGPYKEMDDIERLLGDSRTKFDNLRHMFPGITDPGIVWYYHGEPCFELMRRIQRHVTINTGNREWNEWNAALRNCPNPGERGDGWFPTDVDHPLCGNRFDYRAIFRNMALDPTTRITINQPIRDSEPEIVQLLSGPNGIDNLRNFFLNFCDQPTREGGRNIWHDAMCSMDCRRMQEFLCKASRSGWLNRRCFRRERSATTFWRCNSRTRSGCDCPYPPARDTLTRAQGWEPYESRVQTEPEREFTPNCEAGDYPMIPPCPGLPEDGPPVQRPAGMRVFERGGFDIDPYKVTRIERLP